MNELFLECVARLDEALALVRQHYPADERSYAIRDLAETNAHLLMALKGAYEEYPDLMPSELRPENRGPDSN
jgi:hypothetical protein